MVTPPFNQVNPAVVGTEALGNALTPLNPKELSTRAVRVNARIIIDGFYAEQVIWQPLGVLRVTTTSGVTPNLEHADSYFYHDLCTNHLAGN
jgi:hypothetical protein